MSEPTLNEQCEAALDELLLGLDLEEIATDRFRGTEQRRIYTHIFGGQLLAQAMAGAARTVDGKLPNSMHAYFVDAGNTNEPVEINVERIRDGRSVSTRGVSIIQHGRLLLNASCSFSTSQADNSTGDPPPDVSAPPDTPTLQHWLANASEGASMRAMSFIKYTPPVEIRMTEQPNFLGGLPADGTRSQWMRLPRAFPDNPLLNSLLMTYASDYFLLDMISRADQSRDPNDTFNGTSLDHSLWFHCPVKFDQWHLYTQHVQALAGQRGLVRGTIHDIDGKLVASVMQEGLMRPPRKAGS